MMMAIGLTIDPMAAQQPAAQLSAGRLEISAFAVTSLRSPWTSGPRMRSANG
jgi:hypothetical protein